MTIIVGLIIAVGLLIIIAFPERFLPTAGEKKKRVGANYWGAYDGKPIVESEDMPTIEAAAIKKKNTVIAGSSTYIGGRGVAGSSTT